MKPVGSTVNRHQSIDDLRRGASLQVEARKKITQKKSCDVLSPTLSLGLGAVYGTVFVGLGATASTSILAGAAVATFVQFYLQHIETMQ